MKLGFLKNNKGFSLVECIVTIGIFALMSIIIFQIMATALRQREINDSALEVKNEQINGNVNGEKQPDSFDESFVLEFFDDAGNKILEIDAGALAEYFDADSIYSISKPTLDLSGYEYKLIQSNGHTLTSSRRFYSSSDLTIVKVKEEPDPENPANIIWTLKLEYDAASVPAGNSVIYFMLPSNDIVSVVTDGNALAHKLTDTATGALGLRVNSFNAGSTSATVEIKMNMSGVLSYSGLINWFDPPSIGSATEIELIHDDANPRNYKIVW